jgi:excisionase family DNA binding protein
MQNKNNYNFNEILTIAEVAALLRVHRSTISRYAMSGELKSHLIGTRRLFKRIDVLSFFDNQEAPEYVSRRNYGNS